jgi:hypothetical protein
MDDIFAYRTGAMNARDFRRAGGQGMTKQAIARDQDWRRDTMADAARRRSQMQLERSLAIIGETGKTTREGFSQRGQSDRATIDSTTRLGVADTERQGRENVATTQAGADMYGADKTLEGAKYGADRSLEGARTQAGAGLAGNFLTGYLQKGLEKLRQRGEMDRMKALQAKMGFKTSPAGAEVFVDGQGAASPMQSQAPLREPQANPLYDDAGFLMGTQSVGADGRAQFIPYVHPKNPWSNGLKPELAQQWEKDNPRPRRQEAAQGQAAPAQAQASPAARNVVNTPEPPPALKAKPVAGRPGEFMFTDKGGNQRKLRKTPDGWQTDDKDGTWKYIQMSGG